MKKAPSIAVEETATKLARMTDDVKAAQDTLHRWIGSIVVGWATTESTFVLIARVLLQTDKIGAMISFHSLGGNNQRMSFLRNLAKHRLNGIDQKRLNDLILRFEAATVVRNELCHSEYVIDLNTFAPQGTVSAKINAEAKKVVQFRPFDNKRIAELNKTHADLLEINREVWLLYNHLVDQGVTPSSDPSWHIRT